MDLPGWPAGHNALGRKKNANDNANRRWWAMSLCCTSITWDVDTVHAWVERVGGAHAASVRAAG